MGARGLETWQTLKLEGWLEGCLGDVSKGVCLIKDNHSVKGEVPAEPVH